MTQFISRLIIMSTRTCQCLAQKGVLGSFCGYVDGPYAYGCPPGSCSEDCTTSRGNIVESTFTEPEKDPVAKWELMRRKIRMTIFGDSMPLVPMILVVALVSIVIVALANILKGKSRK